MSQAKFYIVGRKTDGDTVYWTYDGWSRHEGNLRLYPSMIARTKAAILQRDEDIKAVSVEANTPC